MNLGLIIEKVLSQVQVAQTRISQRDRGVTFHDEVRVYEISKTWMSIILRSQVR